MCSSKGLGFRVSKAADTRARELAGLTFFDLGEAPQDTFQRLSALFFIMLLFELLPFCYMSFYVADRQCVLSKELRMLQEGCLIAHSQHLRVLHPPAWLQTC